MRRLRVSKPFIGILTLLVVLCLCAFAQAATEGDFDYHVEDGKAGIGLYTGSETEVVIPDSLGGYPVVSIGPNTFKSCAQNLTCVILPDTLLSLSPDVFAGVPRSFYIKCNPGSVAERAALDYGLQFDNGVRQVIGYQIEGYLGKARWIVNNYITSGMSTRKKVEVIHNWLIYNSYYDYTFTYEHPIGVLCMGYGVCDSYARAMAVILDMLGIPNVTVSSDMSSGEGHAWNVVKVGDTWYHLDATFDDPLFINDSPISGYESSRYFLVSDAQMKQDHTWDDWFSADSGKVVGVLRKRDTASYIENGILYHPTGTYRIDKSDYTAVLIAPFDKDAEEIELGDSFYHHEDLYLNTGAADGALSGMKRLKKLTVIGSGFKDLGKNLLKDCPSLTEADLYRGWISAISESCFENCPALEKVTLGLAIDSIEQNAFKGCTGLQKVMYRGWFFPGQRLDIDIKEGNDVLYSTIWVNDRDEDPGYPSNENDPEPETQPDPQPDLQSESEQQPEQQPEPQPEPIQTDVIVKGIIYKLDNEAMTATVTGAEKKTITKLTVPATVAANGNTYKVTAIGNNAFKKCTKLKSVVIGKNVKTIGKNAFNGCKAAGKFTFKTSALKSVGSGAFKGTAADATYKCPKKQKDAYEKLLRKKGVPKTAKFK